ncbi:hypothetical protein [Nonomuraea turcica]|uniref:hypothetical protein n=1 Tax=Nonomuraea sp. G32 TaxID=3067274 RepID=UPI00273A83B7|nr:hypothetical protein [Nonomuraea sp. G32]MDP4502310.1 hypothetical protein [Nonomuraea sp. G32]
MQTHVFTQNEPLRGGAIYRLGVARAGRAGQIAGSDAFHAGTQHITSSPQVLRECGRELAGLAPDQSWVVLALE